MAYATHEKFRIVVSDRFDSEALARLSSHSLLRVERALKPDLIGTDLSAVNGLIIRSRTFITKELLSRATQLRVIVTSTSGFDHIDLEACEAANVKVMFTPEANAASASELTWGLLLACARKIPAAQRALETGNWNREPLMGTELSGKTIGIIGLGRIGTRVAKIASAFGLATLAYDPFRDEDYFRSRGCQRVGLDELLKLSDVVTCHVPATPDTNRMISRNALADAGDELIFINTSRGSVVSETVLTEALDEGWIAACGLDVFEREPLSRDSKLLNRPNVVVSPHVGATTREAFRAASHEAADKIIAFAERGIVSDELPGSQPWLHDANSL